MGFESYENLCQVLGKWAWIIGIISGLIYIFYGIWAFFWYSVASGAAAAAGATAYVAGDLAYLSFLAIWYIIAGIIAIIFSIVIVRPRFSVKCANKDWDYLLNDVLKLGNLRIPWMLIWGILMEIFTQWWGGLPILIPALLLIFAGPKEYKWTAEEKAKSKPVSKPAKKKPAEE